MKAISVRENVIGNTVKHRGKGTLSFPLFIFEACRWCMYLKYVSEFQNNGYFSSFLLIFYTAILYVW